MRAQEQGADHFVSNTMSFERGLRGLVLALVATAVPTFAQGLQPMDTSVVIFTILRPEAQ